MEGHNNGIMVPAAQDPGIPHGIRALVVDHDDIARKAHEDMLRSLGVETHSVKNGKEALHMIFHDGYKFHLILMARKMPVMDGIETTRILRLFDDPFQIIGVSPPMLTNEEREEFYNAGIDDLLDGEQPLSLETITDICKSVSSPCNGFCK